MSDRRIEYAGEIIKAALYIKENRLTPGHTGNISTRFEQGFLITPTGIPYQDLTPNHIVFISEQGRWSHDGPLPSSEWQFHRAAYAANDSVNALVHTHANYATTLACAGKRDPPLSLYGRRRWR